MMVFERRASAILYNLLRVRSDPRPFLLPANVCPIVPATFAAAGQAIELVDISEAWLGMDAEQSLTLLRVAPKRYGGILFVRPYGSPRDPSDFFATARQAQQDLLIIDDRCLDVPDLKGDSITELADVTLFSTGYAKYSDVGTGGFAFIPDALPYERTTGPAWLDLAPPDRSWEDHCRLTLDATRSATEQKENLNTIYRAALPPSISLAAEFQHWRFNILVPQPDRLVEAAFEAGLFASRHYAPPAFFPVASRLHAQIVNLFNDRHFDSRRARILTQIVLRHLDLTAC